MSGKRNTSYPSRLSPAPDNTLLFHSGCQIPLAKHLGLQSGRRGHFALILMAVTAKLLTFIVEGSQHTDYSQGTENSRLTSGYEIIPLT